MLLVFYLDGGGPSAPIYVDHVISFFIWTAVVLQHQYMLIMFFVFYLDGGGPSAPIYVDHVINIYWC
jgi:hypothetical protein